MALFTHVRSEHIEMFRNLFFHVVDITNQEVCFSSKWNIECYDHLCCYCCYSWGQVSEVFFINLGSRGISHEEDIWHEFEGGIFLRKVWNWEALKCILLKIFLKKIFHVGRGQKCQLIILRNYKYKDIPSSLTFRKKFYSSWLRNYI